MADPTPPDKPQVEITVFHKAAAWDLLAYAAREHKVLQINQANLEQLISAAVEREARFDETKKLLAGLRREA